MEATEEPGQGHKATKWLVQQELAHHPVPESTILDTLLLLLRSTQ